MRKPKENTKRENPKNITEGAYQMKKTKDNAKGEYQS